MQIVDRAVFILVVEVFVVVDIMESDVRLGALQRAALVLVVVGLGDRSSGVVIDLDVDYALKVLVIMVGTVPGVALACPVGGAAFGLLMMVIMYARLLMLCLV